MTEEIPEREPGEYHFRWTKHDDAYPELSHCPSCGEPVTVPWYDPFAKLPTEPVRCDQCDRDLRLPKKAVKDQLCLVCKVPEEEADDSVTYLRLENGERMCSHCLADLRSFKYELAVQQFVAEWVTDDHREALIAAIQEVADEFESEYTFTFNANAKYGRMEPDPDEDLTVEQLIEGDVEPEDVPEEVRREIEPVDGGDGGEDED